MASLFGPHPLSSALQIRVPIQLAKQFRMQAGDSFFWRVSDDEPDVIMLIPEEVIERRLSSGERRERAGREHALELDVSDARDEPGLT